MASLSKQFQAGQKVIVQSVESGYQIAAVPPDQPGQLIVEVAPDYLVVDDADAGVTTRIPLYLVNPPIPAKVEPQAAPSAA